MKKNNIITVIGISCLALGSISLAGCSTNATNKSNTSTSQKKTNKKHRESSSHKTKKDSKKIEKSSNQESSSSQSNPTNSNSKATQQNSPASEEVAKQNITNFLNAAYVYSSDQVSQADQANIMSKYATTDVVTKIFPSAYHHTQKQTNPVVTGTINGPLGIIQAKPNTYIVNFQYQVHNSKGFDGDKVNASYTIIVDNSGKIIDIPEMQTGLD